MMNEFKRIYGRVRDISPGELSAAFAAIDWIRVVVLFGSRAGAGKTPPNSRSDYDFAVSMAKNAPAAWGHIAQARLEIGQALQLDDGDFDLVDLEIAPAGIKESINEGYLLLKGSENELRTLLG
jgi:predicted nucleotidyltransferase